MRDSYQTQQRIPDFRRYEILVLSEVEVKDHLGNVRTVIADYKNISNMYPYGKSYGTNAIYNASEDYRYGFNGMEKEPLPLFKSFSILI